MVLKSTIKAKIALDKFKQLRNWDIAKGRKNIKQSELNSTEAKVGKFIRIG